MPHGSGYAENDLEIAAPTTDNEDPSLHRLPTIEAIRVRMEDRSNR